MKFVKMPWRLGDVGLVQQHLGCAFSAGLGRTEFAWCDHQVDLGYGSIRSEKALAI
jgi:hypothetical protein